MLTDLYIRIARRQLERAEMAYQEYQRTPAGTTWHHAVAMSYLVKRDARARKLYALLNGGL